MTLHSYNEIALKNYHLQSIFATKKCRGKKIKIKLITNNNFSSSVNTYLFPISLTFQHIRNYTLNIHPMENLTSQNTWVQAQSNELMVTWTQAQMAFLWTFWFFHGKEFLKGLFCNMFSKIFIIPSINYMICVKFLKINMNCLKVYKFWHILHFILKSNHNFQSC